MNKTKLATAVTISLASTLFFSTGAQAVSLSVLGKSPISFTGYSGQPATTTGVYTSGSFGTLSASSPGIISFTYLGSESGYNNSFSFLGKTLTESNAVGTTATASVATAGALDFSFSDSQGATFSNGTAATPVLGFAILNGNLTPVSGPDYGPFDYVLGFNDSSTGDADYDDFVVGVNFNLSPVPLPASLPLMAAALGFFTFARRKI